MARLRGTQKKRKKIVPFRGEMYPRLRGGNCVRTAARDSVTRYISGLNVQWTVHAALRENLIRALSEA